MFPARRVLRRLARLWVGQPRSARARLLALALAVISLLAVAGPSKGQGWTSTWTHRAEPPRGPKGSVEATFDTVNARAVLFGSSASESLSEVWQYDATKDSWVQLESHERCPSSFTPPTGRDEYALEYEPINQFFWIFGGSGSGCNGPAHTAGRDSTTSIIVDQTLTGTTVDFYKDWTVSANGATVYVSSYNPWSKILFLAAPLSLAPGSQYFLYPQRGGGTFSYSPVTKSWSSLTGPHWKYTGPQPSNRLSPAMAYSTHDTAIVMFGGQGRNDTWALDAEAKSWAQMIPSQAPGSPPGLAQLKNSMVYDRDNDVFILFGGCLCTGDTGPSSRDTWVYHLSTNTWTKRTPSVSPPPRQGHNLVYDSTNRVVVLFGGYDAPSSKHYNDLWVYSYATNTWTQLFPSLSPPGRRAGAMVYDPVRQRTIVYGGQSPWPLHDVWTLQLQGPSTGNPVPAVTSLPQGSATAGGPAFTLTVTGANFVSSSTVGWKGVSRPTTYVRNTQLQASISATDIASVGTAQVSVATPAPGGGTSNSLTFTVTAPRPAPTLTSSSPTTAAAAPAAVTTASTGPNSPGTSVVKSNTPTQTTTVVSATQPQASTPSLTQRSTAQTPAPTSGPVSAPATGQFLGVTGEDKVGQHNQTTPNGTPDWHIRLQNIKNDPARVQIDSFVNGTLNGRWVTPYNTTNWIMAKQFVGGQLDLWFEPIGPPAFQVPTTFTVQATYANGTTDSVTGIVSNLTSTATPTTTVTSTPTPTPTPAPTQTATPTASPSQPGPTSIDSLQPGQWYRVPSSNLGTVLPKPSPPGNPTNVIGAWSGGAYDTTRDRLIIWGGGHGDYAGNEIYTFDINTLTWSRPWGPSPNIPDPRGTPCTITNSDGNPVSRHTYGGLQYAANIDKFWIQGGSLACGNGAAGNDTWNFDFKTAAWTQKSNIPKTMLGVTTAYDPVTGHIFVQSSISFFEYDPANDTWTKRGDIDASLLEDRVRTAAIDPVNRRFVVMGDGDFFAWDLKTFQFFRPSTSGANQIQNGRAPGFVYDPVSKKLIAWAGGATIYSLDAQTWTWTQYAPAPSNTVMPTPPSATGTYGRFQYIPSKNVFIGVNGIYEDVYVYKLNPGGGTPSSVTTPTSVATPTSVTTPQSVPTGPSAAVNTPTQAASDTSPPTVSITTPASGTTVSGTVSVSANASDNVGVAGVQFKLDGTHLGGEATAPPYFLSWSTTSVPNGTHTLTAVARDAAGNTATAPNVIVTVSNSAPNVTFTPPSGQVSIPAKQWIALPSPSEWSTQGLPSTMKHVTPAYHPPSGRIYFTGGDYAGPTSNGGGVGTTDSYRQETWSLSITERFASPNNSGAGWRLEYPYCGPAGQIQPKHPDYTGLVWDAKRSLFYMVPGVMDSVSQGNCPGESSDKADNPGFISGRMMTFDPATQRWGILGSGNAGNSQDTWMSVLDPVTDTLIRFSLDLKVNIFDIKSQTWSSFGMPGNANLWKEYLAADIAGRAIYAIDGLRGNLWRYNIDARTFDNLGPVPGGALGYTNQTYVAWDSVNKVLFWHKEGSAFYAYHPDTGTWETIPITTNIPGVNATGRMVIYDPIQNVIFLYGGTSNPQPYLFFYRYGP